MVEVDSRTNNRREVLLGFQLEYFNFTCQIECSHQQPEKFVRFNTSVSQTVCDAAHKCAGDDL